MPLFTLACHPETPCAAIERIEARLDHGARGGWSIQFRMTGDARRILAPLRAPGSSPERRDELWRHTCCELFVRDTTGSGYREYNFAPGGDWAAYGFSDYRARRVSLETPPPRIVLERSPAALTVSVTLGETPFAAPEAGVRVGIACVVETTTGLSYWALAHAPGRPDFHHERSFVSWRATDHTAQATQ